MCSKIVNTVASLPVWSGSVYSSECISTACVCCVVRDELPMIYLPDQKKNTVIYEKMIQHDHWLDGEQFICSAAYPTSCRRFTEGDAANLDLTKLCKPERDTTPSRGRIPKNVMPLWHMDMIRHQKFATCSLKRRRRSSERPVGPPIALLYKDSSNKWSL